MNAEISMSSKITYGQAQAVTDDQLFDHVAACLLLYQ
jgi:hypothetical protein